MNSNIDEAVQKAVDNLFDILEQAIQQELLKARIDELESLSLISQKMDGVWIYDTIIRRTNNLQAKLKENSDE